MHSAYLDTRRSLTADPYDESTRAIADLQLQILEKYENKNKASKFFNKLRSRSLRKINGCYDLTSMTYSYTSFFKIVVTKDY